MSNVDLAAPASSGANPDALKGAGGMTRRRGLFDREILARAAIDALKKFDPRVQVRNPVMFVVLLGTVVTFLESIAHPSLFDWLITIWLALTVFFANFAEAVAEGRVRLRPMLSDGCASRPSRAVSGQTAAKIGSRRPIWSEATWSCARRATSFPPTERSSKA